MLSQNISEKLVKHILKLFPCYRKVWRRHFCSVLWINHTDYKSMAFICKLYGSSQLIWMIRAFHFSMFFYCWFKATVYGLTRLSEKHIYRYRDNFFQIVDYNLIAMQLCFEVCCFWALGNKLFKRLPCETKPGHYTFL